MCSEYLLRTLHCSEESGLLERLCGERSYRIEGNSIMRAPIRIRTTLVFGSADEIFRRGSAVRGMEEVEKNTSSRARQTAGRGLGAL
jgi:hypothetical protein